MNKKYLDHTKLLIYRILFILLLFQATRIYFFVLNYPRYSSLSFYKILESFLVGTRFDASSVSMLNSLFILLSLFPLFFLNNTYYQKGLKFLFVLSNSILLGSNIIDSHYFKFTQKRSTFDIVHTLSSSDFLNVLSEYIRDYWVAFSVIFILSFILYRFYPKANTKKGKTPSTKEVLFTSIVPLAMAGIFLILARGVDHRPIAITSAAKFASPRTIALTLNTPFTIIKTIKKKGLDPKEYFDEKELKTHFNPICDYHSGNFKKKNVVILIMESFGKEYSDYSGTKKCTHTPFLDSLSHKALYFNHSFANGKVSMESVSSILNSSPALMDRPYLVSNYAQNDVAGLASLLSQKGYGTSFMHGGCNGTMDFDKFCFMSGFDKYIGRTEYNNESDYDGNWGIFDEPFLQYTIEKMNSFKQPFFNVIFTLSSHHPYTLPDRYKERFKEGSLEIHKCIEYSDFALRRFFLEAKKQDWFHNTLFVITADHTSISEEPYHQGGVGAYSVPIIFYNPKDTLLSGVSDKLIEHIDIMPSVLDYLDYPAPFYAMGKSFLDSTSSRYMINFNSNKYLFANKDFCSEIVADSLVGIYRYKTDSLLKNNLINSTNDSIHYFMIKEMPVFKAMVQTYNNDLIGNKSYYKKSKK